MFWNMHTGISTATVAIMAEFTDDLNTRRPPRPLVGPTGVIKYAS